jgi:hypothetical protein
MLSPLGLDLLPLPLSSHRRVLGLMRLPAGAGGL